MPAPPRITRTTLISLFEKMDDALGKQRIPQHQVLCVFGASAILLYGSDERQTQDIDVWRPASKLIDRDLALMTKAAGISLNPTAIDPEGLYLKVVTDGVVRLPEYSQQTSKWPGEKPSETLWAGRHLSIEAPPAEIIAAAKLVRCEPQDLEDVIYIMAKRRISFSDISQAIENFPQDARERARENLVLLEVLIDTGGKPPPKKDRGPER